MDEQHVWRVRACTKNNDNNIFNGMMLRFRPIAPKPVTGNSSTTGGELNPTNSSFPGKRTKRKYVRIRRNNGYVKKNGKKSLSSEKVVESETNEEKMDRVAVVTLQLMPEKETPLAGDDDDDDSWCKNVANIQILEKQNPNQKLPDLENENTVKVLDLIPTAEKAVVESWITVEHVTSTCMSEDEVLSCCNDFEKVKILETDTCPCFVSNGYYSVLWVNDAYKKMVLNDEMKEFEVVVWLKLKESIVAWCYSYPAFTCGVRLQYTWRNEKCLKIVPCDVWRLECGGFAWRLDVKAALSLGL